MSTNEARLNSLPKIGITIGDPAGIGPEIVLKSLTDKDLRDRCHPVLIGDKEALRRTSEALGLSFDQNIPVVDLNNVSTGVLPGEESEETGKASGEYIEKAVELWKSGEVDAIATAPISKKALNAGGYDFPGH